MAGNRYAWVRTVRTKIISTATAMVLLLNGFGLALPSLTQTAFAAPTKTVCATGCDYTDVSAAVAAATANEVIQVIGGSYAANEITVNQPGVQLIGSAGATLTVPNGAQVNGLNVRANDVAVSGFTINGPVNALYTTYSWGSNISRGITVANGVTGFVISNNTIQNVRNGILVDGRNSTGMITNNIIDNTKSGISVQYTNAGGIAITGNNQGANGNDWGLNLHLNGNWDDGTAHNNPYPGGNAPAPVQQAILNFSTANNGWTVYDQAYTGANRTAVQVANSGAATNQGDPLGPLNTIEGGIDAVVSGGTVNVTGGYVLTNGKVVDKKVALNGQGSSVIVTNGNNKLLTFTEAGSSFSGFTVTKTDNANQNIIGVQAANTTIANNSFSGQYTLAANAGTSRALEVSTTTGLNITGNSFKNLRQPAYINNQVTGTIANNYADQTRGWVIVSDTSLTFTGNSWGTNATDIAIISQNSSANNYTCPVMQTIKANNNNAKIDNQVLTSPCPLPTPTLTSPANGAIVKGNSVTQSWSSTVSDIDHFVYESYNDSNATSLRWRENFTTTSKTATNVANATYWWRVKVVDQHGAESAWSPLWKLTIDNTKPSVNFTAPAANSAKRGTFQASVHASDNTKLARVAINIYNSTNSTFLKACGSTPANSSLGVNSYNFSCTITPATLADGRYVLRASATDEAGNVSTTTRTVTIDNTKPVVTITSPTANSTRSGLIGITGTAHDATSGLTNDRVILHVRPVNSATGNCGAFLNTLTVPVAPDGTWQTSFNSLSFANGKYCITALVSDNAGNNNGGGTTLKSFTINNSAPSNPDPGTGNNNGGSNGNDQGGSGSGQTGGTPVQTAAVSFFTVTSPSVNTFGLLAAPGANNGADTNTNEDQGVLGTATSTDKKSSQGQVKGDSTVKLDTSKDKSQNFLGLGWWWLLILAVIATLLYLIQRQRKNQA